MIGEGAGVRLGMTLKNAFYSSADRTKGIFNNKNRVLWRWRSITIMKNTQKR